MNIQNMANKDCVVADVAEPVSKLIGKLERNDSSEAFVFDDSNLVGVFDHEKFTRSKVSIDKLKVGNFEKRVPKIKKATSLFELAYHFIVSDSHILPFLDESDNFVGGLHISELLKNSDELGIKNLELDTIKSHIPLFMKDDSVSAALRFMYKNKLREALVKDNKGKLLGMIKRLDLMLNYYRQLSSNVEKEKAGMVSKGGSVELKNLPVENFISDYEAPVFDVKQSLETLVREMIEKGTTSVFLRDDEDFYFITAKDIVNKLVQINMPYKENIFYSGLEELGLDDFTKARVQRAASRLGDKLSHYIESDFELTLHLKKYKKEGEKNKYSVNARVFSSHSRAISHRAYGWDPVAATREAIEALLNQVKKAKK